MTKKVKKTTKKTGKSKSGTQSDSSKNTAYIGIIDTLGLDSFTELDGKSSMVMKLRAMANPQRHACVFIATFPSTVDACAQIKKLSDPWDMWAYINMTCEELRCDPADSKTIANIKELADAKIRLTGHAW